MDSHISKQGFAYKDVKDQPSPNPEVASQMSGWKDFGSLDIKGEPLNLTSRCDSYDSCNNIGRKTVETKFCSTNQIFPSWGNGEGWNPYPEDITDYSCVPPVTGS